MLIPMKKVALYALQRDREQLLLALQKTGEFMLVPGNEDSGLPGRVEKEQQVQRIGAALKFISTCQKNKSFFEPRLMLGFDDFCRYDQETEEITKKAEELAERIATLKNEVLAAQAQISQLNPWLEMEEKLDKLTAMVSARLFVGFVPEDKVHLVEQGLDGLLSVVQFYGLGDEGRALLAIAHKDDEGAAQSLLKDNGFIEAKLPCAGYSAKELTEQIALEVRQKLASIEELKAKTERLATQKDLVKRLYDKEQSDFDRLAVRGEETDDTFCVNGWVRYDRQKEVEDAAASVTDAYEIVFSEPEEGEDVPSVTVNKKLIEPYEAITNLYSRPFYKGIDPNPVLAPFYFLFFGIMLGDAGYGIILTVILFFVCRIIKGGSTAGNLARVILMGSVSTVMWGALFGGWFGLEWSPLLFVPMNEPIKMLLLCYFLGALHLATGLFVKMYMEIQRDNLFGAITDQFSWLVMLAGIVLYVILPENAVGGYLALGGMGVILLFAGRAQSNIVRRLLGGVGSLYNITAYISDILSYSRLFALGLATGVIGMVINTIAGMLWDAGMIGKAVALVVLLGGHTFNIAVNVLGAYVHTSRLQFIEFFGKFYEPGGKEFKPLAFRTKYVDIVK